jgi:hypothetical protein
MKTYVFTIYGLSGKAYALSFECESFQELDAMLDDCAILATEESKGELQDEL